MYKLLILFVFFSLLASAQINQTPSTNNAAPEIEKKSKEKLETQPVRAKPISSQIEVFEMNANHLQSELKTISLSTESKTPSALQQQRLDKQLEVLETIDNNSFEYHLLNYQVGNYDFSRIESLKAAEKLKPNNASVLKELSAYSYIMKDEKELLKYLNKLNTQRIFSIDQEVYAANLIQSLPLLSVLITHGESDTYPVLIQQKIKILRQDVEIISLDHLQSKEYRKNLKTKGFKMPNSEMVNTDFFKEFIQLNNSKNIIASGSVPKSYLMKGKRLNTVGLGFSFEKGKADEFNLKYYEEILKESISEHVLKAVDGQILANYLPFLFEVRNSYIENNNFNSLIEIENLITIIGQKANKAKEVKALLNK